MNKQTVTTLNEKLLSLTKDRTKLDFSLSAGQLEVVEVTIKACFYPTTAATVHHWSNK